MEVVATFATNYDPTTVAKSLPDALSAHPDANVYLADADTDALAGVPAVNSAGLDWQAEDHRGRRHPRRREGGRRRDALRIDRSVAGPGRRPRREMAIAAVNGQQIAEPGVNASTIDTPLLVTRETVDQFTPEYGAQNG